MNADPLPQAGSALPLISSTRSSSTLLQLYHRDLGTTLSLRRRQLECSAWTQELVRLRYPADAVTFDHLTKLDLSGNRLDDLPACLPALMPSLLHLNLSTNTFSSIPVVLRELHTLQVLDLSENQLQGEVSGDWMLSEQLHVLRLSQNQFTEVSESFCSRHRLLRVLQLGSECQGGNRLTSLPSSLDQLRSLVELDLSHNQLRSLPVSVGSLRHLQVLSVYNNQLTSLPDTLVKLTTLRTLNVARNQLVALPEGFQDLIGLEMVDLSWNEIPVLSSAVAQFLTDRSVLLAGNPLDAKSPSVRRWNLSRSFSNLSLNSFQQSQTTLELPEDEQEERASSSVSSLSSTPPVPSLGLNLTTSSSMEIPPVHLLPSTETHTSTPAKAKAPMKRPLSLLELAARSILENKIKVSADLLPQHLVQLLCQRGGSCDLCQNVFVGEFHSHVRLMQHYMGHTQVAQQVRLCSPSCLHLCESATMNEAGGLDPEAKASWEAVVRKSGRKRVKSFWKWQERLQHFGEARDPCRLGTDW